MEASDGSPYRLLDLDLESMSEGEREYFDNSLVRTAKSRPEMSDEMCTWQFAWRLHDTVVMIRVADHEVRVRSERETEVDPHVCGVAKRIIAEVGELLEHLTHLHLNAAHITRNSSPLQQRIRRCLRAVQVEIASWTEGSAAARPDFGRLFKEASRELCGAIRTLLTRPNSHGWRTREDEGINCPDLSIDREHRQIRYRGVPVEIKGRKEFAVLELLADAPGLPVSIETLATKVWGTPDIDRNTLEATISRIRSKLRRADVDGLEIEGSGDTYTLVPT